MKKKKIAAKMRFSRPESKHDEELDDLTGSMSFSELGRSSRQLRSERSVDFHATTRAVGRRSRDRSRQKASYIDPTGRLVRDQRLQKQQQQQEHRNAICMDSSGKSVQSFAEEDDQDLDSREKTSRKIINSLSQTNQDIRHHDKNYERRAAFTKTSIIVFFGVTAIGMIGAIIIYDDRVRKNKEKAFKDNFEEEACNMLKNIGANLEKTLGALDILTVSMLAQARATNQTYPYVTISDFGVQAGKVLKIIRAKYLCTYHMVPTGERKQWEDYAKAHNSWIDQSILVQSRGENTSVGYNVTQELKSYDGHYDLMHDFSEAIYGDGNSTDGVDHDGPYLPLWQSAPVIPVHPIYNWDMLSPDSSIMHPQVSESVQNKHRPAISEPHMINWPEQKEKEHENIALANWFSDYLEPNEDPREPMFEIYYPIVMDAVENIHHDNVFHRPDSNEHNTTSEDNFVLGGMVGASIYWRDQLRDSLPNGTAGVVVVFDNPCGVPPFRYEIDGPDPKYLGIGYHNSATARDNIPELNVTKSLEGALVDMQIPTSTYSGIDVDHDACPYTIEVYPSEKAREMFMEQKDTAVYVVLILVLVVSLMTVAFTFLFFYLCDLLVRSNIRAKINLLDAKRNFVRFVSDEVRTSLNNVCTGLALIRQEFRCRVAQLEEEKDGDNTDETKTESKTYLVTKEDIARWSSLAQEVSNDADVTISVLNDIFNIGNLQAFKLKMEILRPLDFIKQITSEFTLMAARHNTKLEMDLSSLAASKDVESSQARQVSFGNLWSAVPVSILEQRVIGDRQRLQQVFRNLLSNAIKLSKNRKVIVKICFGNNFSRTSNIAFTNKAVKEFELSDGTCQKYVASDVIVVDVINTGDWMTPLQLKSIFDPETELNGNSKVESGCGSGLGLAYARAIAEEHSGSLRAYSDARDKGTTLRFELPLYIDSSPESETEEEPLIGGSRDAVEPVDFRSNPDIVDTTFETSNLEKNSGPDDKLKPLDIMVVDNCATNRNFTVQLLESYGHKCGQLNDGQDLVDMVQDRMVHHKCILIDYEMDVMNGPEACRDIREMGYIGLIVAVTGNIHPEEVGHFIDSGADAILPKPLKYNKLEELLKNHLFEKQPSNKDPLDTGGIMFM